MRVKHRLSPQQDACQVKQSVGNTAQRAAVRVTALAQSGIASVTLGIVLGGDTGPVIDRIAQSTMRSVAHDDNMRLAAAPGHWRSTTQCAECLIIAAAERPGTFAEQCSKVGPADTRHGFENHDILPLKAFSRPGFGLADGCAELIELTLGMPQLAIDDTQASYQRAQMDAGRFSDTISNFDGGFSQYAENGLSIEATNAMLLEQPLDRRRA